MRCVASPSREGWIVMFFEMRNEATYQSVQNVYPTHDLDKALVISFVYFR